MSNVALQVQQQGYTQEQIITIKNTVAKGATDDELKMFIGIAQKYDLDPFIKEIWFIKRAKKVKINGNWDYKRLPNGDIDYSGAETLIMTSRDGYLKVAQRDSNFEGIIGFPVKEGDAFEIDAQNYTVNHKFGAKRGKIIGAWAKVSHKTRKPVIVWADFSEYSSDSSTVWKQYPSAMIQKVAEVLALKRQFGISGLVTKEEMIGTYNEFEATQQDGSKIIEITPDNKTKEQETSGKMLKEQKEAIFELAKQKALVEGAGKSADIGKLKLFCMKAVDKPLSELNYQEANTLLQALAEYRPEEPIEPEEKEIIEAEFIES